MRNLDWTAAAVRRPAAGLAHHDGRGRIVATARRAACCAAAVLLAVLACGCTGHAAPSAPPTPRATSSPSPAVTPLTAAELAWIAGIKKLKDELDKPFQAHSLNLTREKVTQLANTAGRCGRELRRLGNPGTRLEPAYTSATKACRIYQKAARCLARAAKAGDADGAVIAGTPQERIQRRSFSCGFAAQGNASNQLTDAESLAQSVEAQDS